MLDALDTLDTLRPEASPDPGASLDDVLFGDGPSPDGAGPRRSPRPRPGPRSVAEIEEEFFGRPPARVGRSLVALALPAGADPAAPDPAARLGPWPPPAPAGRIDAVAPASPVEEWIALARAEAGPGNGTAPRSARRRGTWWLRAG